MVFSYRIIIPARYHSTRLPEKILTTIGDKSMLAHVYTQACQTQAASIVIATDDERIKFAAEKFSAPVCMTSPWHLSGTDRIAEAVTQLNYDDDEIVVNVQGDQPFIPPEIIEQVAKNLWQNPQLDMATLCERIYDIERLYSPSVAKVVMDAQGQALYFSRSIIPWAEKSHIHLSQQAYYQHIGLYAYRVRFIKQFVHWTPSPLEQAESLEQLRALWYGHKIHVDVAVKNSPPEVNTAEDLQKACEYYETLREKNS